MGQVEPQLERIDEEDMAVVGVFSIGLRPTPVSVGFGH